MRQGLLEVISVTILDSELVLSVFCLFVCLFVSISSYDFFVSRLYDVKIYVASCSRVVLVGFQQGPAVTLITNSINFFGPAVQIMANY